MCMDTLLGLSFLVVTAVSEHIRGPVTHSLASWHDKCSSLPTHGEEMNDGQRWKGGSALGKLEGMFSVPDACTNQKHKEHTVYSLHFPGKTENYFCK